MPITSFLRFFRCTLPPKILVKTFGSSVRIMLLSSDQVMRTLVTEVIDGEAYCYYSLGEYTVRAVGICSERPTFKYTRIEIAGVLERLAAGESIDAIVQGFRGRVSREAIAEAGRIVTNQFLESLPTLEPAA